MSSGEWYRVRHCFFFPTSNVHARSRLTSDKGKVAIALSFAAQWQHENKNFIYTVVVGSVLGELVFGQSLQLSGTVTCATSSQIELKCDGNTWIVKLTPGSTTVIPSPAPGTTVTVVCKSPDAQRKESPTWTPAPCSTPKPTATPSQ